MNFYFLSASNIFLNKQTNKNSALVFDTENKLLFVWFDAKTIGREGKINKFNLKNESWL